jgi:hypothetical protein
MSAEETAATDADSISHQPPPFPSRRLPFPHPFLPFNRILLIYHKAMQPPKKQTVTEMIP